jgi:hypothetical protein
MKGEKHKNLGGGGIMQDILQFVVNAEYKN